jgi:hypothetical protein
MVNMGQAQNKGGAVGSGPSSWFFSSRENLVCQDSLGLLAKRV